MNDLENTGSTTGYGAESGETASAGEFSPDPALDLVDEGSEKKRRSGAMVLVAVVVLAIGSLVSMRTLTKLTAGSIGPDKIDQTIDGGIKRILATDGDDHDQRRDAILAVLNDNFTKHQVDRLQRDPFDSGDEGIDPGLSDEEYSRAERRAQFKQAAADLKLKSVIRGSRPLAILNGRIVRLGQKFSVTITGSRNAPRQKVEFRVVSIANDSVTVVAEDKKLEIRHEATITLNRNR